MQTKLVEQIGAMLTSFTQRKTEEVTRTVAGLQHQLDTGKTAIESSIAELNNLSTAATGHLQVLLCPLISLCRPALSLRCNRLYLSCVMVTYLMFNDDFVHQVTSCGSCGSCALMLTAWH